MIAVVQQGYGLRRYQKIKTEILTHFPLKFKMINKGIKILKKDLWKLVSLYTKLKYSKDSVYVACYTCGINLRVGDPNCQAGHYLVKSAFPVHYFNEDNIRVQCEKCNMFLKGNVEIFRKRLINEIGSCRVLEMDNSRHDNRKKDRGWYVDKIHEYKGKIKVCRRQKEGVFVDV